jgi:hypothetical protein
MTWESKRLGDVAQSGDIRSYTPRDQLTVVLKDMDENDYSQVIVHSDNGLELVTVEGVTRWLAQWAERGKVTLTGVELRDVLLHEFDEHLYVMSADQTVSDALNAFGSAITQGKPRLYAILITEGGDSKERAKGIVTPIDLVQ